MSHSTPAPPMTCMIIAFALIMGVVTFAAVVGVGLNQPALPAQPDDNPFLSIGAAGIATVLVVLSIFVPTMVASQTLEKLKDRGYPVAEEELLPVYQQKMIIRLGLLEGAAFMNLVVFMTEQQQWSLGIVGLMVVIMIVNFPTPGRIHDWIKEQKELLELNM